MYLIEIESNRSRRLCVHFGSGVIGMAILDRLLREGRLIKHQKIDWSNVTPFAEWLKVSEYFDGGYESIDIVWAAGQAKFTATQEATEREKQDFETIIEAIDQRISSLRGKARTRFWLMSSAGGIFEGQTHVNSTSATSCQRPYATYKLFQEEYVQEFFESIICRVSSVYSTHNFSGRMGLIPTVVRNHLFKLETTLYGNPSTLRDYVLDRDIGKFVAGGIVNDQVPGLEYLVSGQPTSIQAIINIIEETTHRKVRLKYSNQNLNAANMSFSPKLRSKRFQASAMIANIRVLRQQLFSSQIR